MYEVEAEGARDRTQHQAPPQSSLSVVSGRSVGSEWDQRCFRIVLAGGVDGSAVILLPHFVTKGGQHKSCGTFVADMSLAMEQGREAAIVEPECILHK